MYLEVMPPSSFKKISGNRSFGLGSNPTLDLCWHRPPAMAPEHWKCVVKHTCGGRRLPRLDKFVLTETGWYRVVGKSGRSVEHRWEGAFWGRGGHT